MNMKARSIYRITAAEYTSVHNALEACNSIVRIKIGILGVSNNNGGWEESCSNGSYEMHP